MAIRFLIALLLCVLIPTPAHAGTHPIEGRILSTYLAAGGAGRFGAPVEPELRLTLSGRNIARQRFAKGIVFWSSYVGGRTATYPAMLTLSGVSSERDALASSGFTPGMVFRSAKLCGATAKDRQLMLAQLAGGTIIDLRTSGAASSCPDPSLTSVTMVRYSVNSDAVYPRYVTDPARRAAFGRVMKTILAEARAGQPSWVHCTAGKDRTGWAIVVLLSILGASKSQISAEFMRTSGARASDLTAGLKQVAASYGRATGHGVTGEGMYAYVRSLGLSDADIAALQSELG